MGHRKDWLHNLLELLGGVTTRSRWWLYVENDYVLRDVEDLPWLVLPRHQSFLDSWYARWAVGRPLYNFGRDTIFGAQAWYYAGMIPVRRAKDYPNLCPAEKKELKAHNDEQARYLGQLLSEGESGLIFPEGTRNKELHPWHPHALDRIVLASEAANTHIAAIPLDLRYTGKGCGTVEVYVGEPLVGIGDSARMEEHWRNEMKYSRKV